MTPYLKTERLRLYAPYHRAFDIARHVDWLNDPQTMKWSGQRHGHHTLETQRKYIATFDQAHRHYWEISKKYGEYDWPIGSITAYRKDYDQTANIGLLICRRSWGKGYGSEAWLAVMNWLFSDGIRKCEAGAYSKNVGMLSIFSKTGMTIEGVRRSSVRLDDGWCDLIEVGKFNDRKIHPRGSQTNAEPVGSRDGHMRNSPQIAAVGSTG